MKPYVFASNYWFYHKMYVSSLLSSMIHHLIFSHILDLQNFPRGRAPEVPSLRGATQSPAAVARFTRHQLRWYLVSGSSHCPSRGPSGELSLACNHKLHFTHILNCFKLIFLIFSPVLHTFLHFSVDRLHVRQRCVLCWHGVKECKLLSHLPVGPCWPPSAGWGCSRQHVSDLLRSFKKLPKHQPFLVLHKYMTIMFFNVKKNLCRHELKKASHITKLPKGKHSVKGEKTSWITAHFYRIWILFYFTTVWERWWHYHIVFKIEMRRMDLYTTSPGY